MKKFRPILFSPVMVKAILDGRKNQTRRILKNTTEHEGPYNSAYIEAHIKHVGWKEICPHGKVGDLLWVREPHYLFGHWREVPGVKTKGGRQKWAFIPDSDQVLYEAPEEYRKGRHHKDPETKAWHKRLARFMPRKLCRINLEITGIRVEALQDISEEDAEQEGVLRGIDDDGLFTHKASFERLWDHINGPGSWSVDPWVWVLDFKVVK